MQLVGEKFFEPQGISGFREAICFEQIDET